MLQGVPTLGQAARLPTSDEGAALAAEPGPLSIVTYEAEGLGDRSYLVHDGRHAAVIDAQRDPSEYLATARELGLDVQLVLETHVHNDYVSGGLALSRRTGAVYGVPAGEPVGFVGECRALSDGDVLVAGSLRIMALATPGHTAHHLSYWARDGAAAGAVFTGGSLLAGATGRTDLLGPEMARPLSEAQWHSVRRLLHDLPAGTAVLPTHGFGSFCSSGPTLADGSAGELTIAQERQRNPAAQLELASFVHELLADPLPVPSYYRYMAPINRAGADEPSSRAAAEVGLGSMAGLLAEGAAVVDLRARHAFAGRHWRGALNMELGPNLVTYLGWVVPYRSPLVLIAGSAGDTERARRSLARIGREELRAWAPAGVLGALSEAERGSYPVASFRQLAQRAGRDGTPTVVDVRFPYEWRAGHIAGARNLPLPEIQGGADDLPPEAEIWVHCAGGFRAAVAASWFSGRGLHPVLVDDAFEAAAAAGLPIVSGAG